MKPASRYRVVPRADAPEIGDEQLIEFWTRQDAMAAAAARERLSQVAFVAIDEPNQLVAISTVFLRWSPRLRTDMWHFRTFVAPEHRRSSLATVFVVRTSRDLEERFTSGSDNRAPGIILELESELLRAWRDAVWEVDWAPGVPYYFIGENPNGDHLRVWYFAGAQAPLPDAARAR